MYLCLELTTGIEQSIQSLSLKKTDEAQDVKGVAQTWRVLQRNAIWNPGFKEMYGNDPRCDAGGHGSLDVYAF